MDKGFKDTTPYIDGQEVRHGGDRVKVKAHNSLSSKDLEADAMTKAVLQGQRSNKSPFFKELCLLNEKYKRRGACLKVPKPPRGPGLLKS